MPVLASYDTNDIIKTPLHLLVQDYQNKIKYDFFTHLTLSALAILYPKCFQYLGCCVFLERILYRKDKILLKMAFPFSLSHKPLALQLSIEIDFLSIGKYKFENNCMHMYYGKWGNGGCTKVSWGHDLNFWGCV